MKKIIPLLMLVLLVSGCVEPFDFFSSKTDVKELPPDVILVQNINVLPSPPINAGDEFSVFFELANMEENDNVFVQYSLSDYGLCDLNPSDQSKEGNFNGDPLVPGQIEFVEWTFKTPSSEKIGYLNTECPVRFKVSYGFRAFSEIDVVVISDNRYRELQQSGEFTTTKPTLTVGRGPIKIYMELGSTLPLRSSTSDQTRILPVYITVEDKGTGLLSKIGAFKLNITNFGNGECNRLTCNEHFCYNEDEIVMIKRKSSPIRCTFEVPSVSLEKTFFIDAFVEYEYDIINQVDVSVKPLPA